MASVERDGLIEGRIEVVAKERRRAALSADHASAATALTVDVGRGVFDKAGGQVMVNSVVYTYTDYMEADDDVTATFTLTSGLTAAADDGDWVNDYDPLYQCIATDLTAQVRLPSAVANDDLLHATFAQHLADQVTEDIRGLRGETCLLERDHDVWRIVDILGLADSGALGTKFTQDAFTIATPGTQDVTLTYLPIQNSEHLYWNGLYQPQGTVWSRDELTVTVSDPGDFLAADDVVTVEYAYLDGRAEVAATPDSTPLPVAALAWYSADYEASLYPDGAELVQITDLSGNGNHAICATVGTDKPRIYHTGGPDGGPRIRFANGAYASLPSGILTGAAAGEVMTMVKGDYVFTSSQGWWHFGADTTLSNQNPYASALYDDFGSVSQRGPMALIVDANLWQRITAWSAPNDWSWQQDGLVVHSDSSNTVGWKTVPTIGNSGPTPTNAVTDTWEGDKSVFVLYDRKLTTGERADMVTWMTAHLSGGMP